MGQSLIPLNEVIPHRMSHKKARRILRDKTQLHTRAGRWTLTPREAKLAATVLRT